MMRNRPRCRQIRVSKLTAFAAAALLGTVPCHAALDVPGVVSAFQGQAAVGAAPTFRISAGTQHTAVIAFENLFGDAAVPRGVPVLIDYANLLLYADIVATNGSLRGHSLNLPDFTGNAVGAGDLGGLAFSDLVTQEVSPGFLQLDFTSTVQLWADQPNLVTALHLGGDATLDATFAGHTGGMAWQRPMLTVGFTVVPEPMSALLLGLLLPLMGTRGIRPRANHYH